MQSKNLQDSSEKSHNQDYTNAFIGGEKTKNDDLAPCSLRVAGHGIIYFS